MALTKTGSQRMVKGIGNTVLALMILWTAIPFYWMFVTSLKHDKEIYGYEATLIPEKPTLDGYVTILRDTPYLIFLRNSTVVAVGSTVISLIIACLGPMPSRASTFLDGRCWRASSSVPIWSL